MPLPAKVVPGTGAFQLDAATPIVATKPEEKHAAELLSSWLRPPTGLAQMEISLGNTHKQLLDIEKGDQQVSEDAERLSQGTGLASAPRVKPRRLGG